MDRHADTLFLYQRGQDVRWAVHPGVRWRILWRRYTEPDIMGPIIKYRLDEPIEAATARECGSEIWACQRLPPKGGSL